ncbi:MAG TPA: lipopolysaccharide transport periplasmic protein LptA [Gammaproteobacteria bacterium]|nr:lipopolysaccharide transport periplasmic protein LptA [Gammaproteobacteria bacterium]
MLLLCCALLTAVSAFALSSDKNQPMDIQADHGEWQNDNKTNLGTGIYTGHVIITQGSIRITADHAVVHTRNGELQTADITGQPATFQQQPDTGELMHGIADQIHYNSDTNMVDMIGHAHMQQGSIRQMTADVIHYNTATEHAVADGGKDGGRVHITVPPKTTSPPPEKKKTAPQQAGQQPAKGTPP